jgi:hypothetical protein
MRQPFQVNEINVFKQKVHMLFDFKRWIFRKDSKQLQTGCLSRDHGRNLDKIPYKNLLKKFSNKVLTKGLQNVIITKLSPRRTPQNSKRTLTTKQ